ncbi:MAG TPA: STM3941 family protein [Ktedonobacterales bacterium]|nr:STM3941 family protein [Ktedonobacterales bacterium]
MPQDITASTLIYAPSRRRLLLRLALLFFLVAAFILALVIFLPGSSVLSDWRLIYVVVGTIVFTAMTIIQSSALIYRLAHPAPSIIVREDGIVDNGSLIYSGVGFIPWTEIGAIATRTIGTEPFYGIWRKQFLVIIPVNWRDYEYLLPRSLRLQRTMIRWSAVWSARTCICIPRFMLPGDAKFVRLDISTAYYHWHPHADGSILFD